MYATLIRYAVAPLGFALLRGLLCWHLLPNVVVHLNVSRSVVAVHLYNCARALSPKTKLEPRALSVLRVRVSIFYGAYKWLQHDNRTPCTITGRTSPHQRGQPRNWDVLSKVRRIRNSRRYTHSRRVQLNPTNDGTCSRDVRTVLNV